MCSARNKQCSFSYENDKASSSSTDEDDEASSSNTEENDESSSCSTDDGVNLRQKIGHPRPGEDMLLNNKSGMKLRKMNKMNMNESDKISSVEECSSIKKESKVWRLECFKMKLNYPESGTEQAKNEVMRTQQSFQTRKNELNPLDRVKQRLNFEEKLTEKQVEVLANNVLSSDSEFESDRSQRSSSSSSDSGDSTFQEKRLECPDVKPTEEVREDRKIITESLAPKHDFKQTLHVESFKRSPVKLKLKRKIVSPSSSDTSSKETPQKCDSDIQSANFTSSKLNLHKLRVRKKVKSPKWIITNSEDILGKKRDKDIKKNRKMSSWKVISKNKSQDSNVSENDSSSNNDVPKKSLLRDRSKIRLPAWRTDNDPQSKILKICIPKYNVNSPNSSLRVTSKEKENKTPHKNEIDSDSSVTTSPLRDRSKIKLPIWRLNDDSSDTTDMKSSVKSNAVSPRCSGRIARQLKNKSPKSSPRFSARIAKMENKISNKHKEDTTTDDEIKSATISPLRDRSKIKVPSWREGDAYKPTSGRSSNSRPSVNSPKVSKTPLRQLHEDMTHVYGNITPKRGHSNMTHTKLSSKKKRSLKTGAESNSDSSDNCEEDNDMSENHEETPQEKSQYGTPKSSKRCDERKFNITTPVSRKNGGRLLLTPKIEDKSRKLHGTTPSTPLDQARIQLHISTVPESLPCRQNEFKNIEGFLMRKVVDHAGGSMYISGMPGTGKTATVHAVIRALQQAADNNDIPKFDFVEVNGLMLTEPRQAYVRILQSLTGQRLTAEQAQGLLEKRFSGKKNRCVILFVDELDYLCNRRQDVVYNVLDWPTKHNSGLVVLTVSNTMDLPERTLKGRVTSRMGLTRLSFQPYTHHQLQEIVLNRLAGNNCFHPDAVQLVARKVAAVSGDARRALDICRRATELVTDNEQITVKHVEIALTQIFTGPRVITIRNCSQAAQLVLRALRDETQRTGVEETNVIQMYNHLVNICTLEGTCFGYYLVPILSLPVFLSGEVHMCCWLAIIIVASCWLLVFHIWNIASGHVPNKKKKGTCFGYYLVPILSLPVFLSGEVHMCCWLAIIIVASCWLLVFHIWNIASGHVPNKKKKGLPTPKVGDILGICTTLSLMGLVIAEKGRPDIMRKLSLNVSSDDIHYALSCGKM